MSAVGNPQVDEDRPVEDLRDHNKELMAGTKKGSKDRTVMEVWTLGICFLQRPAG